MKKVSYRETMKVIKESKYESTTQVVDSILQFESLITYRLAVTKGRNPNYVFLSSVLDEAIQQHKFYRTIIHSGKEVRAQLLINILRDIQHELVFRCAPVEFGGHIHRDTMKVIKLLLLASLNLRLSGLRLLNKENESKDAKVE